MYWFLIVQTRAMMKKLFEMLKFQSRLYCILYNQIYLRNDIMLMVFQDVMKDVLCMPNSMKGKEFHFELHINRSMGISDQVSM